MGSNEKGTQVWYQRRRNNLLRSVKQANRVTLGYPMFQTMDAYRKRKK